MTPAPTLIEAISQRLESFLSDRRAEADGLGAEARLFVEHAADAVRGGKRLRARFCVTGWRAVRGADGPAPIDAVGAAAALEVFQAAALVHDDIIDNSDTRRGRPAAHRALEAAHIRAGWAGDAAAFGRSGALLLGDLLVAWSDDLFEEALGGGAADGAARRAARAEYALMRREVTLGQFLDIAEESAWSVADEAELPERAMRVASYKSARYSVQQPLVIGAALAGASTAQLAALRAFGLPIGLAFQLRDDVLGVFGDAAQTGKPAGDDLREGKRTLLVAYTRQALDPAARAEFDASFGRSDLTADEASSLAGAITRCGALARVEDDIARLEADAERALVDGSFPAEAEAALRELALLATRRQA